MSKELPEEVKSLLKKHGISEEDFERNSLDMLRQLIHFFDTSTPPTIEELVKCIDEATDQQEVTNVASLIGGCEHAYSDHYEKLGQENDLRKVKYSVALKLMSMGGPVFPEN